MRRHGKPDDEMMKFINRWCHGGLEQFFFFFGMGGRTGGDMNLIVNLLMIICFF